MGGGGGDSPTPDCAEKVHVSSLALLKMLKHGRAGVPMEGKFVIVLMFVIASSSHCFISLFNGSYGLNAGTVRR